LYGASTATTVVINNMRVYEGTKVPFYAKIMVFEPSIYVNILPP